MKNDEHLFGLLLGNECHLFKITIMQILMLQEVTAQIWATLYDYPCLKDCPGLRIYIDRCVRVSWGLVNQVRFGLIPSKVSCFDVDFDCRFLSMRLSMRRESSSLIYTFVSTLLRMARKAFAPICGRHCGKEKRDPAFIRR